MTEKEFSNSLLEAVAATVWESMDGHERNGGSGSLPQICA
jgi:hypothetical protein